MKNEERILELLAEALQRIDRHSEEIKEQQLALKAQQLALKDQQNALSSQQNALSNQHNSLSDQQQTTLAMLVQLQKSQEQAGKHNETLDKHAQALLNMKERTEAMHQSSLEQQKAYQAMTELLMHHNRVLSARGIL